MSATQTPVLAADPSMEDILASIRRILSEEDLPDASPAEPVSAGGGQDQDVLVLDDFMLVKDPSTAADAAVEPAPEPVMTAPEPTPITAAPVLLPVPRADPPPPPSETPPMSASLSDPTDAGLTSPETEAAAASSVSNLIRALTSDRTAQVHSGGPTIADLVREEIRPVLKTWLDTNLPPLVERMVRAEIERVIARATA